MMRRKQITVTNNLVSNNVGNIAVEWKGMKKRLLHFKKKFVPALSGAVMGNAYEHHLFCGRRYFSSTTAA